MPNTLAHIGVNSLITKRVIPKTNIFWIYLGCVISDFPWIFKKIIYLIFPTVNGYNLHAYSIVQASLFFSLLLSLSVSFLSKSFKTTFFTLFLGSLLHLLLDPLQIKWANGVHFFAPFHWELTYFGFFLPEHFITYLLTLLGFIVFIYNWKEISKSKEIFSLKAKNIFLSLFTFSLYATLPFFLYTSAIKADNHFLGTLTSKTRKDKYIEMDRKNVVFDKNTNSFWIESFNKELIELSGIKNIKSNRISIKGKFKTNNLIYVTDYTENWAFFRDGSSYLGLSLILFCFIVIIKNTFS
ncbi:MAG: hypothetical protein CR986_02305 [Ignavibacteriae bacterium]|nr:MAG: hypothetical protein CR986_02305 [Ignavibacteriota bacterium]